VSRDEQKKETASVTSPENKGIETGSGSDTLIGIESVTSPENKGIETSQLPRSL